MKTTCFTNIYNEEYLLPFWLSHHKDMFDEIIIVDYRSTDASVEICKKICPKCQIITTRNDFFGAREIDSEFMDLEQKVEGIKIVLNTTEFLFSEKPIQSYFENGQNTSFSVTAISPYSKKQYFPTNNRELFLNLFNDDVVFHRDRSVRFIHNYNHGNYTTGRHETMNPTIPTNEMHIVWFGYYPLNEQLLHRKLQIQTNIPQFDKDVGFGFHHLFPRDKLLSINEEKTDSGISLREINLPLFLQIENHLNEQGM